MRVCFFHSYTDPQIYAFTYQADDLPQQFAPWRFAGLVPPTDLAIDLLRSQLAISGVYLARLSATAELGQRNPIVGPTPLKDSGPTRPDDSAAARLALSLPLTIIGWTATLIMGLPVVVLAATMVM